MLNIIPNLELQPLNTMAIPALARYGVKVHSLDELGAALSWRREKQLEDDVDIPLLVIGGGSNIILRGDFPGLLVQVDLQGKEEIKETAEHIWLKVGAGENWHSLVEYSLSFHYWGLENLALIPGCVGAAPIQNIGAYGVELKDVFAELTAVDIQSGVEVVFEREACEFGYRDSVFKQRLKDRYIITSVTLKLSKNPTQYIEYPALASALSDCENITPEAVFEAVCRVRRSKLPDPALTPNTGSFFKNPIVDSTTYQRLHNEYANMPAYVVDQQTVKLAAGWLIDKAGWRGKELEGIVVHKDQALVLTNPKRLPGSAVLAAAEQIASDVKAKFGVQLEMEPRVYGNA
ncbi:UDP-N-acetylmuramate dehydrogenase [Maricurvus nonylphenolicus]|uniref:UDP-N-acetylmuramate dehydrogenase n=1 Tax=Maricurvus nonylphenolicus TaxID=1008307 RepID=UPI0036F33DEB